MSGSPSAQSRGALRASDGLRIFVATPTRTVYRSTDRDYVYRRFTRLGPRHGLTFVPNSSRRFLVAHNGAYLTHRVAEALGIGAWLGRPPPGEAMKIPRDVDLVFSYGLFPLDPRSRVPIVWEQTFAPTRLVVDERWGSDMIAERTELVARAAAVVTATEASVARFRSLFPRYADRIHWVPYYLPDVEAIEAAAGDQKWRSGDRLRMLFVGKEGRRKGLDTVVEAYSRLTPAQRSMIEITVVSAMLDGPIALPSAFRREESVADMHALMRESHVLLFPTKQEAFGLVLVEAMAAGCAIVTTCAEIQRSIVGGKGGIFVDPTDASALAQAIGELIEDGQRAAAMGRANRARFLAHWHHEAVGDRYATIFRRVAARR